MKLRIIVILLISIALKATAAKLNFEGREASTVGIAILNLSDSTIVAKENLSKAMMPASILKCLTSATSLLTSGTDFQYETLTEMDGTVSNETLNGNLVIRSSGDPTICSAHFPESPNFIDEIVAKLQEIGIKQITGDIIVDESEFSDTGANPGWTVNDVGHSYGAGFFGFNYSDNTFKINTNDYTTVPDMPFVEIVVDYSNSDTEIIHGMNSDYYVVRGRNVEKPNFSVETTMNRPSEVFVDQLTTALDSIGITVEGNFIAPSNSTTPLLTHVSPPNIEIVKSLMFRSDNMMAEATLRSNFPHKSRQDALTAQGELWESRGFDMKYTHILDGSGLARGNRVTPAFMARLLYDMAHSPMCDEYLSLFPHAGREGTIKYFLRGTRLENRLALKSGSVNGVQCYAGYKLNSKGVATHAVVIMVNDFFCKRANLRKAIENYLLTIF